MRARDLLGVQGDIEILPVGFTAPVAMVRKNRRELGLPEGVPLVVGVGRLIARKRYDMFLAVLQKLPNVHGVIVGEGQLRSYLEDRAKKLGVNERVHFLGFVSDDRKWEVLESADVYLSTAEHEGFGIVFLEAMAAGLPVVAVSHGGQEDFLVHEKNGFFAGVGEEAKLPGFIETLLADNDLRKDIGRYNRLYVERYKDTHVGEQFLDILRRVTKV